MTAQTAYGKEKIKKIWTQKKKNAVIILKIEKCGFNKLEWQDQTAYMGLHCLPRPDHYSIANDIWATAWLNQQNDVRPSLIWAWAFTQSDKSLPCALSG